MDHRVRAQSWATLQAARWWERSLEVAARLDMRLPLARTHFEVTRRLREDCGEVARIAELSSDARLERAEALLEELELRWDLERLAELRSHGLRCAGRHDPVSVPAEHSRRGVAPGEIP